MGNESCSCLKWRPPGVSVETAHTHLRQLPSSHVPRWSDESLPTPTRHGRIPTGRVLIPREAGQPDDETTLVFDLAIALHYSRHEISGVDKLWVSSPNVSGDDVLSVTALALDSHSCACPRPESDAANPSR